MATGRDEPQAGQQGGRAPQRGEQRGQWLGPAHWPAAVEASFGTVLRAVGQLLVAISGDGRPSSEARPAGPYGPQASARDAKRPPRPSDCSDPSARPETPTIEPTFLEENHVSTKYFLCTDHSVRVVYTHER